MIILNSLIFLQKCRGYLMKEFTHCFYLSTPIFLDEIEKAFRKRKYNLKDQFGTLNRDKAAPQVEKFQKGFENPWLKPILEEDILKSEIKYARKKWELNCDKFENALQITVPFRAIKKMNRQKQKELKEYKKSLHKQ